MKMHYGNNQNFIPILRIVIQKSIRKPSNKAAPDAWMRKWPHFGIGGGPLYCCKDFHREIVAQPLLSLVIIINGLIKLGSSLRVKRVFHREYLSHIARNTSSPGTAFSSPEYSSAKRLWATSPHFFSISDSNGLRLRSAASATSARSSTGREAISFKRSSVFIGSPVCRRKGPLPYPSITITEWSPMLILRGEPIRETLSPRIE